MNCRRKKEFIMAAGKDGSGVGGGGGMDKKLDKRLDLISSKCVTLAILIICTLHMYQDWKLGP